MVVWGLLAALAAGISFKYSFLFVLPLTALFYLFLRRLVRRSSPMVFLLVPILFWYGHYQAGILKEDRRHARQFFLSAGASNEIELNGVVSGYPQAGSGRASFRFATDLAGKPVQLLVYANAVGIGYGDSLRLYGKLRKRRGKARLQDPAVDPYLFSKGTVGAITAGRYGVTILSGSGGDWLQRRVFWPLHDRMRQEVIRRLAGNSGIPLALLLGERGYLDRRVRRTFIELGISHLLALSGMHLGLIAGAILLLLRRFRVRNLIPLLVILTIYLGTVGEVLSLYRAYGMALFLIMARMIHRPLDPMHALGTAVFLLLLWSPHIFFSIGFQLSFTATFAVLLCVKSIPIWTTKKLTARLLNYAVATIYVGVFVQVFIAPLLIHHFDRLSVVSPLATLIFFPFVFVVLFLSILCAVCGMLCPILGDIIAAVLVPVTEAFAGLLLFATEISPPLIHLPHANSLIYCAGITILWRSKRAKWKLVLGVIFILSAFAVPFIRSGSNS
jgi:competence protein ComEC